jgi:dynein heavy chain
MEKEKMLQQIKNGKG